MVGAIAALSTKRKGDRKPYEAEDQSHVGRQDDRSQTI
jgi:hypothetical protein